MHTLSISELIHLQIMGWTIATADRVSVANLADMIIRDMPEARTKRDLLRAGGSERQMIYDAQVLVWRYENYLSWALLVLDAPAHHEGRCAIEEALCTHSSSSGC